MYYYEVAPAKIFRAGTDILTYEHENKLPPGTIVFIPLGKTTIPGLIIKQVKKPDFLTRPITKILYQKPLPRHLLKSLLWLSTYYACPLGSVLQTALPRGIEKTRRANFQKSFSSDLSPAKSEMYIPDGTDRFARSAVLSDAQRMTFLAETGSQEKELYKFAQIPLNDAQLHAISEIKSCKTTTALLHGITGSGKTNIYLELTRQTLANQKSAIILVPEIALTSQLVQDFQKHFNYITLLHSKQTESTRHLLWQDILNSTQPQIIIGPRSALFAPIKNLGLIIIDEAHEPAYHQDQAPKYSATKLASVMISVVKNNKTDSSALALMGTATPTIADYYLADQQKAIIVLDRLAIKNKTTTHLQIIDLKDRSNFRKHRLFSDQLLAAIQNSLQTKTQTMIFHNRRGSAPLTICDRCGWQALCPRCLLPQNLHADKYALICHACGLKSPIPTSCPTCHHANILHKGFGTKHIESELTKLFPNAKIARFDADTPNQDSLHLNYEQIKSGHIDIIIGTQIITKGFDLPLLTTLGVIQADAGLALPDFSSEERTFQLLTQVIGRANRGHQNSSIIIQTYQPDHPVIKFGTTGNYQNLYNHLIKQRQKSSLPPYSYLLKLTLTYKTEEACIRNIQKLREEIENLQKSFSSDLSPTNLFQYSQKLREDISNKFVSDACRRGAGSAPTSSRTAAPAPRKDGRARERASRTSLLEISAPTPAFHERTPQGLTWQLIVRSKFRQSLLDLIKNLPPSPHLHFHLDPPSLL